ncbi:MAG: SDR family NAD(P)-dependent oxidoreductase [Polyangiales bacterium]
MYTLNDKVALVTGGSRGIGRACAIALAKQGAHVAVAYNQREDAAQETLQLITAANGSGELMKLDVTSDEDTIRTAVRGLFERRKRLDILINNAGTSSGDALLASMSEEAMEHQFRTNFWGFARCTKAVVPLMMQKRWGRIVSIGSIVAAMGNSGQTIYAASKAAMEGATRSLAREYGRRGISANVVAPGLIKTDMTSHLNDDALKAAATQIPLARVGTPEDVAAVVAFLCTEAAGYVTGQVIAVNGGMYM